MFLIDSGQFGGADFISDVCQIANVEHFFYGTKILESRQKIRFITKSIKTVAFRLMYRTLI